MRTLDANRLEAAYRAAAVPVDPDAYNERVEGPRWPWRRMIALTALFSGTCWGLAALLLWWRLAS
jgi:hypothetical protein